MLISKWGEYCVVSSRSPTYVTTALLDDSPNMMDGSPTQSRMAGMTIVSAISMPGHFMTSKTRANEMIVNVQLSVKPVYGQTCAKCAKLN